MSYRLSKKVVLEVGDKVRISSGPYYVTQSGQKISMSEKGIGTFHSVNEDETGVYVKFRHGVRFVYIGTEHISENTGMVMRPHKITKVRK
jgi:hypothetical protein